MRKILITPYFGPFPEWMDKFQPPEGYDWLLDTDLDAFKKRVMDNLGIDYPGLYGNGKVWDYRGSLGHLYLKEIKGYDFYGCMDFDVVWGDMNQFYTDSMLNNLDVVSGHNEYVCGCFSLFRNCRRVNELFLECDWKDKLVSPEPNGWIENEYSRTLEQSGLRYKYTFEQGNPWVTGKPNLRKENDKLFQDDKEIAFYHFRHFKHWPL